MHAPDITLRGWLGSEVTLTETSAGPVASFRVGSTPRRRREGAWEDLPPVWFTVKAWDELARNVAASLGQGQPVVVHGRFAAEAWCREDGTQAGREVVVATSVGHDLRHGRSRFERRRPARGEAVAHEPGAEVTREAGRAVA